MHPFTREIRNQEWMDNMMAKLKEKMQNYILFGWIQILKYVVNV